MKKLLIMLLLSCFLSAAYAESHVDASLPAFTWERNALEHWRILAGRVEDKEAHTLEDDICTICGSEVWHNEDGSTDVSNYNSRGDLERTTTFDASGSMMMELCYTYDYDEAGRLLTAREFSGDVLVSEITYGHDEDGASFPAEIVTYFDDGSWTIEVCDIWGNTTCIAEYNKDGVIAFSVFSEYALSESGSWYELSRLSTYPDGEMRLTEYAETGAVVKETEAYEGASMVTEYNSHDLPAVITYAAADGTIESVVTYEYEYGEDNTVRVCKTYTDGVLTIVTEFAVDNGVSYACRETLYDNDGSYTVCIFAADDTLLSETRYDSQGRSIP